MLLRGILLTVEAACSSMASKTKLSWKRKRCESLSKTRLAAFADDENEDKEAFVEDWRGLSKKLNLGILEDSTIKSARLKNEGIALAELQRYWESISKWNEAIQLTPQDEMLHEMKAQVFLELGEIFPAIRSAEIAVSLNPRCTEALQTLGRAQLGMGELDLAIRSFSKALHIKPDLEEIWNEDLRWAQELKRKRLDRSQMNIAYPSMRCSLPSDAVIK